jgi:toxin ParE1/3/4
MKVRFTPQAREDIGTVYSTIARSNPNAAQCVENLIRSKIDRIALFPQTGSRTRVANVRRLPLVKWPYTIFYRIVTAEDAIDVLRVVHGAKVKNLRTVPKD